MAIKSLLLDVDGVIVRDKLLMHHLNQNCVEYVRAKLPECKDPALTNKYLYLAHGHTARGLQTAFKIDTSDFNQKVYDKSLLDHLSQIIYSADFQEEAKEIHEMTQKGWNVTLFTNSPIEWASLVANAIGDEVYIKCAGPDASKTYLKPDENFYTGFSKAQTHVYIDDSLKNIGAARQLPNWHPVYFNEGEKEQHLWCPQVGSIWELCMYVNSVDQWIHDA
jgi:FMN phosphatase YigB (HAD superfamily)